MPAPVKVAVLGTGNIGTDLLLKLLRRPELEVALFAGVDPDSDGIARARSLGGLASLVSPFAVRV